MNDSTYYDPDEEIELSSEELRSADRNMQINAMRAWFYKNFENPVARTPYETREGGYQWIWGGPYDASEELHEEFNDLVPHDLIDELVKELNDESWQWGPAEQPEDYDDYLFTVISQQAEASSKFDRAILDIEKLLETDIPLLVQGTFYRLLYVNVIFALETYLSDTFISAVANEKELMRKYVESAPEFKVEKFTLAEVFNARESIEAKVKSTLVDIVWHNFGKIKPMYKDTLGVNFPDDMGDLHRSILIRHDIVHRNGKKKDGGDIVIATKSITDLIQAASALVRDIDAQMYPQHSVLSDGADAPDF